MPYLKFLGYDLSDETWTSSLLNCGRWEGELMNIAQRVKCDLNWSSEPRLKTSLGFLP